MIAHIGDILIYTLFGFAVLYPFFLWFTPRKKIDSGFYNFNLGLSGVIGGMALVLSWSIGAQASIIYGIAGWLGLHLVIAFTYWNNEKISNIVISFSSLVGWIVFAFMAIEILPFQGSAVSIIVGILSQAILASVMFAMILGHWFLNVVQLPIRLLQKVTNVLAGLIGLRFVWNMIQFPSIVIVDAYGISRSFLHYVQSLDGFFLGVAFFFGLVVPLTLHIFIWRTLKLHATQSATGLLYISVLSLFIGDLCYKYVLFQDGLIL